MKKKILRITMVLFTFLIGPGLSHGAESIKIALIFAKTGIAGSANLHHFQGARFAVNEINQQGGLLGKKVELLEFDNCSSPIQSKLAAKKAVKAGVVAVIGASWSSHSLALTPVLQKSGIPMISPDSTNPKVTREGDYIFRACFIDPFQGEALAKFATREFQAKTAVIAVKITSAYSLGLAEMFRKHFEQMNGKVLAELEYKQKQTDFEEILVQARKLSPDILFVPGHDESGLIVKQAQEMGIKSIMLGGDGWAYRQFYVNGGQELKQGFYTTHWSRDLDTPETRDFVERYQRIYEINDFATITYDAVMLLADAIRRAGSEDRIKIRDALSKTRNFRGVTGDITFDKNGDPVKPAVIMKIENGKATYFKTISP